MSNFLYTLAEIKATIMNNILDLINGSLGNQVVDSISRQAGASKEETQSVVSAALPALFGALQRNASEGGATGILNAINKKHDGSILDNLADVLGADTEKDGNGILKHLLGGTQAPVQQALSQKTGVSAATVSKILALLAPVVMGYLGKQTKSKSVDNDSALTDMLGGLLGGGSGADILGGLLGGGGGKKDGGNLGSILGGLGSLFGKK